MKMNMVSIVSKNKGASLEQIAAVEQALGVTLPAGYKSLVRESNGLEGFVAPGVYLSIWPVDDLPRYNEGCSVRELCPGVLLFGSDGSDMGYGYTVSEADGKFIEVPFVGMEPSAVRIIAETFEELIEVLQARGIENG